MRGWHGPKLCGEGTSSAQEGTGKADEVSTALTTAGKRRRPERSACAWTPFATSSPNPSPMASPAPRQREALRKPASQSSHKHILSCTTCQYASVLVSSFIHVFTTCKLNEHIGVCIHTHTPQKMCMFMSTYMYMFICTQTCRYIRMIDVVVEGCWVPLGYRGLPSLVLGRLRWQEL